MKKYKIVHLDDHKMITLIIRKLLIKVIPDCECISFTDTDSALNYMIESIKKNEKVNLLITDFNHPGLNGYEFAKTIRLLEKNNKYQHVPILLLTMLDDSIPIIRKGLKEDVFNNYLSLNTSESQLIKFFNKTILSVNPSE